jgi:hypothetical protein
MNDAFNKEPLISDEVIENIKVPFAPYSNDNTKKI